MQKGKIKGRVVLRLARENDAMAAWYDWLQRASLKVRFYLPHLRQSRVFVLRLQVTNNRIICSCQQISYRRKSSKLRPHTKVRRCPKLDELYYSEYGENSCLSGRYPQRPLVILYYKIDMCPLWKEGFANQYKSPVSTDIYPRKTSEYPFFNSEPAHQAPSIHHRLLLYIATRALADFGSGREI